MPSLNELVGQVITAHVPMFHKTKWQSLKLLAVENSGLWVESQAITEELLKNLGVTSAPKTMILFLPFHQIAFVIGSRDVPSLSEKAFLG